MKTVVNLNQFRKKTARAADKARANENVVKHGRTKAAKSLDKARTDKAHTLIDQHKRDDT